VTPSGAGFVRRLSDLEVALAALTSTGHLSSWHGDCNARFARLLALLVAGLAWARWEASMKPIRLAATRRTLASVAALWTLAYAGHSEAQHDELDACGGLLLQAAVTCEAFSTATCSNECVPVAMEETCAYRLTTSCEGSCNAAATLDCQNACETTCVPSCTSAPAEQPPNCMGLCMSDCQQDCNATCANSTEPHCRASCAHTCSRDCRAECDTTATTDCTPLCTTACAGSCAGRAAIDCQVACQSAEFATCETQAVQECTTHCESSGGGIFCDGQFCSTGDLQACANQLQSELNVSVDLSATGHIETHASSNGICTIGSPNDRVSATPGVFGLVLGLVIARSIRRRR